MKLQLFKLLRVKTHLSESLLGQRLVLDSFLELTLFYKSIEIFTVPLFLFVFLINLKLLKIGCHLHLLFGISVRVLSLQISLAYRSVVSIGVHVEVMSLSFGDHLSFGRSLLLCVLHEFLCPILNLFSIKCLSVLDDLFLAFHMRHLIFEIVLNFLILAEPGNVFVLNFHAMFPSVFTEYFAPETVLLLL